MEDDFKLMTREQYMDILVEASFQDASEMEVGFESWCKQHVPVWRRQGCSEKWIRQRVEMAQRSRNFHRMCKKQGLTMLETRDALLRVYTAYPKLYDLALVDERLHPGRLRYRGNTGDFRQRYTLRVQLYETDKQAYEQFCRCIGQSAPDADVDFVEQSDDICVTRDLSTVEELEMSLAMSRYMLHLLGEMENSTQEQLPQLIETYGEQLRADFLARHGYQPEDSATPYIPVTIEGLQDHDASYAREFAE